MSTHGRWLKRIPLFRSLADRDEGNQHFLATLTTRMHLAAYIQEERLPLGRLYILRKGLVIKRWRVLAAGQAWGEDILLDDDELIDHAQAVAMMFVEAFHLSRDEIDSVGGACPEQFARVCKHVRLHLKMQRVMIRAYSQRTGKQPKSFAPRSASSGYMHAAIPSSPTRKDHAPPDWTTDAAMAMALSPAVSPMHTEHMTRGATPEQTDGRVQTESVTSSLGRLDALETKLDSLTAAITSQQGQLATICTHLRIRQPPEQIVGEDVLAPAESRGSASKGASGAMDVHGQASARHHRPLSSTRQKATPNVRPARVLGSATAPTPGLATWRL